ncbi:restriction endonuclease subunit S [Helicobacter pylori]|uniref:restriction endonuclease subunit S n=1 Tax=Helicobacter pylori TaxID=210 RepID=UPI0012E8284D|nr:restriction endonuclease subunit S [Helicobacter pylori]MUU22449.1 restriction endonuclease subunit S [Helicobacter pylori]MUU37277.1 restriction endonuclease subunit S [Helicobacter pylori]WQV71619.1 restriction endonuclease subunit S [Helicobacter pylori]
MDALMLPLNWQKVRLGDIAEIKRGASPRPIENPKWFCTNSNVGWVRISDISKNSRFLYKTAQKLSKKGIEKSRFIKQNSLIMSMCATIGKPIITKIDTCIHDGFVVFENPKIDLNYLYYFLCYIEKEWLESGQQGSQVNLNVDLIKNKEVFCPKDLDEQAAIANILSDLDHYLCSLDALILKKESVKKALSFELLSQRKRLKGFNQAWQRVKVKDFGIIITGSTPLTQISEYWNGTISWITPTDINDNKDIFNSERKITQKGLDTIRMIPKNSVLVTCIASIGKNAILRVNGACNQQINAIIPNKDFNADFVYYLMENNKQYLLGKAGVTATYIISKQVFEEIDFFVPKDLNEQIAIANILSDLDSEIISLKNKKRQFENIKKALNHDLMSAKIRV